jgi:peptide/nickel transport system permease protein
VRRMKIKRKSRVGTQKRRSIYLTAGVVITAVFAVLMFIGFIHTPYSPNAMNASEKFMAPSPSHIMGTDNFGRDIFSRVLKGISMTGLVAVSTVAIGGGIGTVIGAVTGYYGGIVDEVIMRINDALNGFPSILLALVIVSIAGPGKYNVIMALGILFIPSFARIVRSEYISLKERDFVKSARLMGAGNLRIIFRHIFPNVLPTLFVTITIGFNNAVLAEAGLSYLGIGIQPPDASLGSMLSDAQSFLFTAPWYAVMPGMTIVLFVLGFSLLAEGIREKMSDEEI